MIQQSDFVFNEYIIIYAGSVIFLGKKIISDQNWRQVEINRRQFDLRENPLIQRGKIEFLKLLLFCHSFNKFLFDAK